MCPRKKWMETASRFLRRRARLTLVLPRARRAISSGPIRNPTENRMWIVPVPGPANFPARRPVLIQRADNVPDLEPGHQGNLHSVQRTESAKATIAHIPSRFLDHRAAEDRHFVPTADPTTGRIPDPRVALPAADRRLVQATGHIPSPTTVSLAAPDRHSRRIQVPTRKANPAA